MSNSIVSNQANTNIIRILVFVNKFLSIKTKILLLFQNRIRFQQNTFNTIWHNV